MENEKPLPLPLSGDKVKAGILAKVEQSLMSSCHLKFDNAYTKVRAEISIRLTLDDYGREVKDNHNVAFEEAVEGLESSGTRTVEANVNVEPVPPNVFRVETGQVVPVVTIENRKQVVRNVKYSPRKLK